MSRGVSFLQFQVGVKGPVISREPGHRLAVTARLPATDLTPVLMAALLLSAPLTQSDPPQGSATQEVPPDTAAGRAVCGTVPLAGLMGSVG